MAQAIRAKKPFLLQFKQNFKLIVVFLYFVRNTYILLSVYMSGFSR
jgi:hypothetical protein